MTNDKPIYYTCAETAKLLRAALKEAFPGMKFSVRSATCAGGASIDVAWTDGPTNQQVQRVCHRFEGADFDGMIDLKTPKTHTVNGKSVHYGADFIFAKRRLSVAFLSKIAQAYCTCHRCEMPAILEQSTGASIRQTTDVAEEMLRQAWATSALEKHLQDKQAELDHPSCTLCGRPTRGAAVCGRCIGW
jgi:Large polyvalent protein associated domain 29